LLLRIPDRTTGKSGVHLHNDHEPFNSQGAAALQHGLSLESSIHRLQIVEDSISVRFGWSGIFDPDGESEYPQSHQYDQGDPCPMKPANRLGLPVLARHRHVLTSKFGTSNLRES
jgi:hypothetical protein